MFSKSRPTAGVITLLAFLGGCGSSTPQNVEEATEGTQVVATTGVLCDLTQQIAQDAIALTCLLQPGQDPHTYTPTSSDRRALEDADLILYGGYGFEPGLIRMIDALQAPTPAIAVYEVAVPDPILGAAHDHEHEAEAGQGEASEDLHTEEQGETHGEEHEEQEDGQPQHSDEAIHGTEDSHPEDQNVPDPHVWHSAENGERIVTAIAQSLSDLTPSQATTYQTSADRIESELVQIHRWIQTQVETIPSSARSLVTTHDSFHYFAQAYGLTVKGALSGLSTEARPSAGHLAELVEVIKSSGVPAIFAESSTNRQLIETIARDAQVSVAPESLWVEGPGGTGTPAETYQQMLIENTCTIVTALGGTCDRTTLNLESP